MSVTSCNNLKPIAQQEYYCNNISSDTRVILNPGQYVAIIHDYAWYLAWYKYMHIDFLKMKHFPGAS